MRSIPKAQYSAAVFLSLLAVVLIYNAVFSFSYSVGPNYRNVSIDTRVNITNAAPEVVLITCPDPITLNAGTTTLVACNVTVRDFNGYDDINFTDAVFFHSTSTADAADDNNTHYTQTNCSVISQNGDYANYSCNFTVYYYALNGTWTVNATVYDILMFNGSNENTTSINSMLALNVTPILLDYGNLSIGDTSTNKTANVSNIGNIPINVSVKGYGDTENDGLSFVCTQRNISIEHERFSTDISHSYAQKASLSNSFKPLNLTIVKQDTPGVTKWNMTYWQLYVPPNPFGICNGTLVFQAESAS